MLHLAQLCVGSCLVKPGCCAQQTQAAIAPPLSYVPVQAVGDIEMDESLEAAVHEYWVGKRTEFGRPLLPRLWFEDPWAKQIGARFSVCRTSHS